MCLINNLILWVMGVTIEKAIKSAKASLSMAGLYLEEDEEALIKEKLQGKITEEEFNRRVLEQINKV